MNSKYKVILHKQVKDFFDAIKKAVSIDCKTLHICKMDYPILMPDGFNYCEQTYYQGILSWYIRNYLITGILTRWLKASGRKCYVLKASDRKCYVFRRGKYRKAQFMYSNTAFGCDYPFAFIVENKNGRIGYRYSPIEDYSHLPHVNILTETHSDLKILSLFNKYQINRITTIEWENTTSLTSRHKCNIRNEDLSKHIDYITIRGFITEFFSDDLYQYYIGSIREAVEEAYKEIGYQTVSNLSPKHLSDFRDDIVKSLQTYDLQNTRFILFSKTGELTDRTLDLLSSSDYDIIMSRCFSDNLISVLSGENKFARCFITSEHLFSEFKKDCQEYYDYSTIVSGYFKSVELFLEEAMITTFSHPAHENLLITAKTIKGVNKSDWITKGAYKHIKFKEQYKNRFKTDMGSLIEFLHDNTSGWRISESGIETVYQCLRNYNQGCRNEHLHKDIISDIKTVDAIRTNTILCLLYLLGGYKIYDDPSINPTTQIAVDQEYNCFYKAVKNIPVERFIIKPYNRDEIKAIRLYDQNETEYDKIGNIITGIDFAIVDTFPIEVNQQFLSQIKPSQELTITKNNIPEKMWWSSYYKGQEIKRGEVKWRD